MVLTQKIGRYNFDILSVVLVEDHDDGSADLTLPHGVKLSLTAEEKSAYDSALDFHKRVLVVYGMARSAGLRG